MTRLLISLMCVIAAVILPSVALTQSAIVADHNATILAAIPDAALVSASNLRLHLRRASVGGNISAGLDALRGGNAKYNRSRWIFGDRGNPGWQPKVDDMVSFTVANASSYDVLSMKFCYIDPAASFSYYRDKILWLESNYPGKRFIWWTIPIETSGNTQRQSFNDSVRTFAKTNGKILFDIADIEATSAAGQKQIDGSNRETMRSEWTSDGGHLSTAGAQRVASAMWWLMARIAGWDGSTAVDGHSDEISHIFYISQNYPNPFNPSTMIEFTLAEDSKVVLKVFNVLGREVSTLVNDDLKAGVRHQTRFDASQLSSGVYFYRLEAGKNLQVKKLIFMK